MLKKFIKNKNNDIQLNLSVFLLSTLETEELEEAETGKSLRF